MSANIRPFALIILLVTFVPNAAAQQLSGSAEAADTIAPFLGETTILIVKFDLQAIELPDLSESMKDLPQPARAAYAELVQSLRPKLKEAQAAVGDRRLYATVGMPISSQRVPVFLFAKGLAESNAEKLRQALRLPESQSWKRDDYTVFSPTLAPDVARQFVGGAVTRSDAAAAFDSVAKYPIQALLLPPSYLRRTIEELSPELPRQLGGGSSRVLTEGVKWAAIGVDLSAMQSELVIESSSAGAAAELAEHLPKMLQSLYRAAPEAQKQIPPPLAAAIIDELKPQVDKQRLVIRVDAFQAIGKNLPLLASLFGQIQDKVLREQDVQKFKQILLAMHNYHDAHRSLPTAEQHRGEEGKPLLSWRVHLLPYLGEAKLYQQFRLNEPWDSPHNKQLIARMPEVYQSQSAQRKGGATLFQAPVGVSTAFGQAEPVTFGQIADGLSNTVALVKVKPEIAVPWTAPRDYEFDPQKPAAGLSIGEDGRWLSGFADGSVHQLQADIPRETFLRLFEIDDGQVIDFDQIH